MEAKFISCIRQPKETRLKTEGESKKQKRTTPTHNIQFKIGFLDFSRDEKVGAPPRTCGDKGVLFFEGFHCGVMRLAVFCSRM